MPIVTTVSNRQVANWLGYKTPSAVSRIRSGAREPSRDYLIRIEEALNYPIADQVRDLDNGTFTARLEERILYRARLGNTPIADSIPVTGMHKSDRD